MNEDVLKLVADNKTLFEALREKLLNAFDISVINLQLPNEQLGEQVRALLVGAATVELAFRDIERLKTINSASGKINPAR